MERLSAQLYKLYIHSNLKYFPMFQICSTDVLSRMPTAGGGAVQGGARGEVGKKRNTDCDTEKHDTER